MGELPREADTLTHSFELIYRDDAEFRLGELTITASLHRVYDELRRRVGFILATQFLIIFVVSILILWIFRHLVTRHLADMADYTRDLSLRNLSRPLELDRPDTPAYQRDELGMVTEAINQMRERLTETLEEARAALDPADSDDGNVSTTTTTTTATTRR